MKGERTCDFRASHDPATLEPLGPACGKPAVQELRWADGRFSLGCAIAISEARVVVSMALRGRLDVDRELYDLEMAMYKHCESLKVKRSRRGR